jgi:hypothetical protein
VAELRRDAVTIALGRLIRIAELLGSCSSNEHHDQQFKDHPSPPIIAHVARKPAYGLSDLRCAAFVIALRFD